MAIIASGCLNRLIQSDDLEVIKEEESIANETVRGYYNLTVDLNWTQNESQNMEVEFYLDQILVYRRGMFQDDFHFKVIEYNWSTDNLSVNASLRLWESNEDWYYDDAEIGAEYFWHHKNSDGELNFTFRID